MVPEIFLSLYGTLSASPADYHLTNQDERKKWTLNGWFGGEFFNCLVWKYNIQLLLQGECRYSVMSNSLWPHELLPIRLLCPWGLSKQKYWRGLPYPSPGDLPNPGIEPRSPALQADSLLSERWAWLFSGSGNTGVSLKRLMMILASARGLCDLHPLNRG